MKITINGKLPSLNEVIDANRSNKYAGSNLKKKVESKICAEITRQCSEKFEKISIPYKNYGLLKMKIDTFIKILFGVGTILTLAINVFEVHL